MAGARVLGKKVDGLHQLLHPEADRDGERRQIVAIVDAALDANGGERVGEADARARQPLELFDQSRAAGSSRP